MDNETLERVAFRRVGSMPTPETILADKQSPKVPRERRAWSFADGAWVLKRREIPSPRPPKPAPTIQNLPVGPVWEIYDRTTGARLWIIRGHAQHVAAQVAAQLHHAGMKPHDVKPVRLEV